MKTLYPISFRPISTSEEIKDAYQSLLIDIGWSEDFDDAKKSAFNFRTGALAEKLLRKSLKPAVHEWLEKKSTDFNPGTVSESEICVWTANGVSGNDWGAWKRLRLVALLKQTNGLCFYTKKPLKFGLQDHSDDFAELDHVIPELRDNKTGFYGLDLSPIVICRLDANRMRGHLPFSIWLEVLKDPRLEQERQLHRSFVKDARNSHSLISVTSTYTPEQSSIL